MLQITKRAGATPQQLCEFQTNQTHKVCLTHSQLCQLLDYALKIYGLDTCIICPDWNMSRSRTTSTLQIQNERELHPSNTGNYKTSRGFTTTTLRNAKRARAASQQHCELRNEQELHHDKIENYKTNRSGFTVTQQSTL